MCFGGGEKSEYANANTATKDHDDKYDFYISIT